MCCLFAIACLMKWQPIVIVPFTALYVLHQRAVLPPSVWSRAIRTVVVVLAGITASIVAIYGWPAIDSLYRASRHGNLSSFGANARMPARISCEAWRSCKCLRSSGQHPVPAS